MAQAICSWSQANTHSTSQKAHLLPWANAWREKQMHLGGSRETLLQRGGTAPEKAPNAECKAKVEAELTNSLPQIHGSQLLDRGMNGIKTCIVFYSSECTIIHTFRISSFQEFPPPQPSSLLLDCASSTLASCFHLPILSTSAVLTTLNWFFHCCLDASFPVLILKQ